MNQDGERADSDDGTPMPGGIRGDALAEIPGGFKPLRDLQPGDLAMTLDAGPQPVLSATCQD